MNYKLRANPSPHLSGAEQVLTNRGIPFTAIDHWINTTDADINHFNLFGEDRLHQAATALAMIIGDGRRILVIVDCDCDGFTSAALLINYLYDQFPAYTTSYVDWFIHSGKQHGLSDVDIPSVAEKYSLVITPDASSNDYEYHLKLIEAGVDVLVLDHHEAEIVSPNAIVINNQLCDYPNKFLSGVGVTWQFCRYLDDIFGTFYADNYLDLVALGNTADMMSLTSIETKHLINKGFCKENIHNPFIYAMAEKNEYTLKGKVTAEGAAWYIAPFVNAMVRSGTDEEKELLFKSFLKFKAFDIVLSDKRGHRPGETEQLVTQAIRVAGRVKNRQTDAQDEAMEMLEALIEERDLLSHKVLLFLLEPGQVDRNIAGLAANKIMGKYQRPCAVLTRREQVIERAWGPVTEVTYEGSARGCDAKGVYEFKDICENTGVTKYVAGHQGAFGLGVAEEDISTFIEATDQALAQMPDEPFHLVDYIYKGIHVEGEQILSIAELADFWGKDVDESLVAIEKLRISSDMVNVYVKKDNTLKITLPNKISLMLFHAPQDLCDKLRDTQGYIEMNIVGTCNANEYMGWITPQVFIKDYEITGESRYCF